VQSTEAVHTAADAGTTTARVSFCPLERQVTCVRGPSTRVYHADHIFKPSASADPVCDHLVPELLRRALSGAPSTVVAAGAPRSGKSTTLFADDGLFVAYVQQLLYEFERQHVAQLYRVECTGCELLGGGSEVVDLLAPPAAAAHGASPTRAGRSLTLTPVVLTTGYEALRIATQKVRRLDEHGFPRHIVLTVAVKRATESEPLERSHDDSTVNELDGSLVRTLGAVAFVEVNASLRQPSIDVNTSSGRASTDSRRKEDWDVAAKEAKQSAQTLYAVLHAELRRRGAGMVQPFAPMHEAPLTRFLAPLLGPPSGPTPTVWLLMHVDTQRCGKAAESTLEMAAWLLEAKYPQGLPGAGLPCHRPPTAAAARRARRRP
jgi:hypothetical protein